MDVAPDMDVPHALGSTCFLASERLGFRWWRNDDLALAVALWGDPAVTKFIDARGKLTEAQVNDRLSVEISTARRHGVQYWPMFLLSTDEFVGCGGLRPHTPSEGIYEIGLHLLARHWGRGYATEAAGCIITYAFETLGAARLFAGHHPENSASRRVLSTLGFRYTHDEYYAPTGLFHPSYLLAAEKYAPRV